MKSKKIIYIFLAVLTFIVYFSSCEKMAFEKEIDNTPIENYDYLWNEVNEKYAFLEYKSVNINRSK